MRPVSRTLVPALVVALGGALLAQQRPTFSVGVDVVEVDVHVVDGKGAPVRNLKQTDFKLFEDGKEQALDGFVAIDVPITTSAGTVAAAPPTAADVAAAVTVPANTEVLLTGHPPHESRFYLIILDDRQIDEHRTQNTVKFVSNFIVNHLAPNDLAAVVSTSGRMDASQTFTSDKAKLLKATQRFMGSKLESMALMSLNRTFTAGADDEHFFEAMASMEFVERVISQLGAVQGRSKAVLLVSEGLSYNTQEATRKNVLTVLNKEREMIAAATRANVTIHPVDPRGLFAYDELTAYGGSYAAARAEATRVAVARERGDGGGATEDRTEPRIVGVDAMSFASKQFKTEVDLQQSSLRAIAASTNGVPLVNTNKIDEGFQRIVRQESTYYLLSYRSQNERREGKFRKIEVKVQGRGLKVEARKGYTEARSTPSGR